MKQQLIKCFLGCCIGFQWFSCAIAQPNINRLEYYIDNDPGYGKATAMSFTQGTNLANFTASIDPGTLGTGIHIFGIRAKDANNKWSLDNKWLFVKNATAPAISNIIKVEYYIDTDPGYGKATDTVITQGTNLINLAHSINPASVSPGIHMFGIRAKDANGAWSLDNKWLFVKEASAISIPNITKVEYYVDTDPGYGKATDTAIAPGTNLANLTHSINPASLSSGLHIFGVRARDANGKWSLDNKWLFVKDALPATNANIVKVEYYIDADPGYGKALQAAITPSANLVNIMQNVSVSALSGGAHFIGIRALDSKAGWSLDNKLAFTIPSAGALPIVLSNFNGRYVNNANELTGVIQQAVNVKAIQIEKSTDGTHFVYLNDMTTAPVTSSTYKYQDKSLEARNNYYRLRIVDLDGDVSYSHIILLTHGSGFTVQMYPNPVQDNLIAHFANAPSGIYTIRVTDILGKDMLSHKVNISQNNQSGDANISFRRYAPGTYLVQVTDAMNKMIMTQKIMRK